MAQLRVMHFTKTQFTYWWSRSTNWANGSCWSSFTLRSFGPTLAFSTRLTSCTLWAEKQTKMRIRKPCRGNRGRLWHQYEESANKTHRRSSKSTGTYRTRLTTFTLKRGQGRDDWLAWSLKGQFSEHHVFDTGIIVEITTYRDTTGTSRTSRTSRTSFSLKESTKYFDTGKWPHCSQNRNAPVVQIHTVSLFGSQVQRMLLKMVLGLILPVFIISNYSHPA